MELPQKKIYDLNEAREKIRRFCAYQERSQKQVVDKLKSYGLLQLAADELLLELIQDNYLNEQRFATAFARGRFAIKGWGVRKIEQELWRHGVSKPCIAAALAEIDGNDYSDKLSTLAKKKWESLKGEHPNTRKQKTIRYLLGRGFMYEDVDKAIQKIKL